MSCMTTFAASSFVGREPKQWRTPNDCERVHPVGAEAVQAPADRVGVGVVSVIDNKSLNGSPAHS